ncbi:MAG: siphovirus Gp157 family protein [Methylobacter sp.]
MTTSLYNLTGQYLEALDFLTDPENGIDEITIKDTLESIDSEIDNKMLNVGRFILELEHQAEGIKEARRRMEARQKSAENKAQWLKEYLVAALEHTGKRKLADVDIALSLAKLPPAVIVDDELLIPDEFKLKKIEIRIDKAAIKQMGGCPGCRVESAGFRISIK